eukprot:Awhi_evm2s6308
MPVRKDDEVMVVRGNMKDKMGSVKSVFRKKWMLYFTSGSRDKLNGMTVDVGIHPSNVVITKLHMDKDREDIIKRKSERRSKN